ncbi:MAG TPA: hypothetical protein VMM76_00815 [Pirellulaceae bacterium]|nr:hypothetical protein [Pirellulaceae bacterium]
MPSSSQSAKLKATLLQFQTQIEKEVDVDDQKQLQRWVEAVREAFDELHTIVDEQRQSLHTKLYDEIGDQDESQRTQIHEFQEADAHIDQLIEIVKSQLIVLTMQASSEIDARIENQGSDDDEPVLQVVDRGIELIHWIRDQEEAVASWFAEAFAEGV